MPNAVGTITVKLKLTRSEERNAIADFVEYALKEKWEIASIVETIRSGDYLIVLVQKSSVLEINGGLG